MNDKIDRWAGQMFAQRDSTSDPSNMLGSLEGKKQTHLQRKERSDSAMIIRLKGKIAILQMGGSGIPFDPG